MPVLVRRDDVTINTAPAAGVVVLTVVVFVLLALCIGACVYYQYLKIQARKLARDRKLAVAAAAKAKASTPAAGPAVTERRISTFDAPTPQEASAATLAVPSAPAADSASVSSQW
ncbi:hypothetical protein BC828DRAFT_396075 [Blastocladiella britannica]|nr:hypothetical protein BC828DRAFT_396075 [Blastocladiella britannica]